MSLTGTIKRVTDLYLGIKEVAMKGDELDVGLTNRAQFTLSDDGEEFACEECGHHRFIKISDSKAKCARDWCGAVYNVEYSMLDLEIIFFEG